MTDPYMMARDLAVGVLRGLTSPTPEQIRNATERAVQAAKVMLPEASSVDASALEDELLRLFSVEIDDATILDDHDPSSHIPWLEDRRANIQWRFWGRYARFLERGFGMAPAVVGATDDLTDKILGRLEDPQREGSWDRRGMVVGSVQSGKTANYAGLICKAVDAGYKLVIILAGIHSNLRAQTQLRIDEAVLGFDTQKNRKLDNNNRWIGVGAAGTPGERLIIHSLTSSAEDGDFNRTVANNIGVMPGGGDPVVLVVKKNSRVLKNLLNWIQHFAGSNNIFRGVPLLLIDDEADNASINIKSTRAGNQEDTVSAINGKIRELLSTFEQSAYVGYTATPFANIFINPEAQTDKHGEDIFPKSFIINVKPPSSYVGPERVFGLEGDLDAGLPGRDPLPIIREISDYDSPTMFPPKHRRDHNPQELPGSLKRAIRCFILACAARRARGQEKAHNSMLIHVTRFVDVQSKVESLVSSELRALQRRIEFGDGARRPSLVEELGALWEEDFVPVTSALGDEGGRCVSWADVSAALHPAAAKIVVLTINGFATEALDYKEHETNGRSVIVIGGDKLSRGLTLEGLSVSYFLRTSRMYDTLMQMGRWFGYRPGYLDLCRLFTTEQLVSWYRHIALAEAELRREFDYMVAANRTPRDYGLRVRTHPDGMIVTALNKMCHTQTLELSWSGVLVQTAHMPKDAARIRGNREATERLLQSIGAPLVGNDNERQKRVWAAVRASVVADYLETLRYPPESARATGAEIADFVRKQASKTEPELTDWTVALISNPGAAADLHCRLGGWDIGLIERTPESQGPESYALRKANILNPIDESLDLANIPVTSRILDELKRKHELKSELDTPRSSAFLKDLALELTRERIRAGLLRGGEDTATPNGRVVREVRPKKNGLLLIYPLVAPTKDTDGNPINHLQADGEPIIGVGVSFPVSNTTGGVEYRVNRVWGQQINDDYTYEDQ